ncbi:hypothetical protein [Nonlabens xiamenensis]|uniref:hypothetical protein n=1 Tax=Nonlabens xiamenensis TaxID=2341043 RepID=UPI000F60DD3F|nr:hypothetical protein [Nonlabens xiamenensis]|tara:strand:- start:38697 stop:39317 length:621 start_codon:yes stop_codon:yes gene_type:complete
MKLRPQTDNIQLAEALKRIVPQAITLTEQRVAKALQICSGGKKNDLDTFFGEDNTVDKTKFLANIFNPALEDAAKTLGVDYITEETVGYDAILLDEEIENKMSLGSSTSSFATGNNHSKTKVDKIFCVKLTQKANGFPEVFACLVDLSLKMNPNTGWSDSVTKTGKNNNGFSTLKIHNEDAICITPIYGRVRKTQKYVHTVYETIS